MESKQLTYEELLKLVTSGKASALQSIQFADMLKLKANETVEQEKHKIIEEIDNFIVSKGLKVEDYLLTKKPAKKDEPEVILFDWEENGTHYIKIKGTKGKWKPKEYVKGKLTYQEALKFAQGGDEGVKFVKALYDQK